MNPMYFVSCRKEFWSDTDFSDANEIRKVDLDGERPETTVTEASFLDAVAGQRALLLVHGYNNDRADVLHAYRAIFNRMKALDFVGPTKAYETITGFIWPGGASGVSFLSARLRARDSAPRFFRLLAAMQARGVTLDLNTHSLGAAVAFEALRAQQPALVRNAWNFASAVDNESIETGQKYHRASQACRAFYVFHSNKDDVLRFWYRLGDLPEFDQALGYAGPENPRDIIDHSANVKVVNCKKVVASHGGYRASGEVYAFMAQELSSPAPGQFFALAKTDEAVKSVFLLTAPAGGGSGKRRARKPPVR